MIYDKGDKIGNYTVTFQHKQGAYAETYRVKDPQGKTRFLKLINYGKLNRNQIDDEGRVIELKIARQLNHHNLCQFIDSGNIVVNGGQRAFFVTEFVSGETLSKRFSRNRNISVYDIKRIAISVLSALHYLHTQAVPIVHNEVTIQNVMLNLVGDLEDLKLIDFGHARFLNQAPAKPDMRELSPFYMAPERFSGVSQVQSDLYSVGVIIYQLLFGELPWFVDLSRAEDDKVDYILSERNKPLSIPNRNIFELDDQLINCIAKALQYDADDRFQTAQEFIKAIQGEIKVLRQETGRKAKADEPAKKGNDSKTLIKKAKGPGFAAIAGMDELKQEMRTEVIDALRNPEKYQRYGITIPNGILLYGPPGCGKTFFAKHFAEEVGFNFMHITPASLKSKWINATQENIANMFKEAEENAPTIIFIDELDDLLKDRSLADDKGMSGINEFLAQMDRTGEKGIFIIGATNKPELLDPAVLRAGRLEKKFYVGVPDKAGREALFRLYLETRPYDFGLDYGLLADMTNNYVSADIQLIVNDAARAAMLADSKITMELLKSAIGKVQQSLPDAVLQHYETIRAMMTGQKPVSSRPRIGLN